MFVLVSTKSTDGTSLINIIVQVVVVVVVVIILGMLLFFSHRFRCLVKKDKARPPRQDMCNEGFELGEIGKMPGVQETDQLTGASKDGEREQQCSETSGKNSIKEQYQEPSELPVPERDQNNTPRSTNDCKTNQDYKALKRVNALETNHYKKP